jgi:hypothetical protein
MATRDTPDLPALSSAANIWTRQYVVDNPDVLNDATPWIVGVGWEENLWEDQTYPLAVHRVTHANRSRQFLP